MQGFKKISKKTTEKCDVESKSENALGMKAFKENKP